MRKANCLTLLPAADRIAKPWKNGGGTTRDVVVMPEGAGMEDFDWRVSIADVASDGPFSAFPGIDRIIAILSGDGIRLAVQGFDDATLSPSTPPYAFPGDVPTAGMLLGGPITDLNLMFRRGRISAGMRRIDLTQETEFALPLAILLWVRGEAELRESETKILAGALDAVLVRNCAHLSIRPKSSCSLYVLDISPI